MNSLFRPQSLLNSQATYGEVSYFQPLGYTIVVGTFVILISIVLLFCGLVEIKRTKNVTGYFISPAGETKVFAKKQGILTQIFVKQGSTVKIGDPIAIIENATQGSSGTILQKDRVIQLKKNRTFIIEQDQLRDVIQKHELNRLDKKISTYKSEIKLTKNELDSLINRLIERERHLSKQRLQYENGIVSWLEFSQIEDAVFSLQTRQRQVETSLQNLETQIVEMNDEITILALSFKQQSLEGLIRISKVEAEIIQIEADENHIVSAPSSGVVSFVSVSLGESTTRDKAILNIIPEDDSLVAKILVPNDAISTIKVGYVVTLIVDAYPFQLFGSIPSRIVSVTSSAVDPREFIADLDQSTNYFSAIAYIEENPRNLRLYHGMTFSAEIETSKRTIFSWLFEPFEAVERML